MVDVAQSVPDFLKYTSAKNPRILEKLRKSVIFYFSGLERWIVVSGVL